MIFSIQILGSNSALAAHGRHPTSQVVNCFNDLFLVDCGEGTQMRMSAFHVKRSRIRNIFISHLHGDHYFGLIGLLTSYHLMGRTDPLMIFGPSQLESIVRLQLEAGNTRLKYDLQFTHTHTEGKELLLDTGKVKVYAFPLNHRIPTTGFLFVEQPALRKIDTDKTAGLGLQHEQYEALREGRDIEGPNGETMSNAALTLDPPTPRSYAFCSDTVYDPGLKEYVKGVDLLYHEATFLRSDGQRAADTYHSTTEDAARVARLSGAGQLMIGHYSSKYTDLDVYLRECREIFPATVLAQEGAVYSITRSHSLEMVGSI